MSDVYIVAVLVVVAVLAFAYAKYLETQQDASDLILEKQTSVSSTRKTGETASYRSNLVAHGLPLIHGLAIKHLYKLRDGSVKDVWAVAMQAENAKSVSFRSHTGQAVFEADHSIINGAAKFFKNRIAQLVPGEVRSVAVCVAMYSYENFLVAMGCFLAGVVVHGYHEGCDGVESGTEVIFLLKKDLARAVRVVDVKLVVVVDDLDLDPAKYRAAIENHGLKCSIVTWHHFWSSDSGELDWSNFADGEYIHQYAALDELAVFLKETVNYTTTQYTQQNIVSGVAAELKALPLGQEWSPGDTVCVYNEASSIMFWHKVLALFVAGCKHVAVVEPLVRRKITTIDPEQDIRQKERENKLISKRLIKTLDCIKPTVAVIPESYLAAYMGTQGEEDKESSFIRKILIGRSQMLLQRNIFNHHAQLPWARDLRIVYSFSNNNFTGIGLSSWSLSMARSLFGARIVQERYLNNAISPVFASFLYDYRAFENLDERHYAFRGVPSQAIECKLVDYEMLGEEYLAENKAGELCVRGFIIGKSLDDDVVEKMTKESQRLGGEGWMPTGLVGYWGEDGCFYEKLYWINY